MALSKRQTIHTIRTRLGFGLSLAVLYALPSVVVLSVLGFVRFNQPAVASSGIVVVETPPPESKPGAPKVIKGEPSRLVIKRLSIDLKISPGLFDPRTGTWTLSDDRAYYAKPTPLINNQAGNTLIYGHNIWQVFSPLHDLQRGDTLKVYTRNGRVFTYVFTNAKEVKPNNLSVFSKADKPQVTLQTCSGRWNEWRKLFNFKLTGVT